MAQHAPLVAVDRAPLGTICIDRQPRSQPQAAGSDQAALDRARRPNLCKLACHPFLRRTVSIGLRRQWSPEQIAGWLKRTYPGKPQNQVSHETIIAACSGAGRAKKRAD
jgi:IS30 family transposase